MKRVLLIILDGFGEAPHDPATKTGQAGNAITQAKMTFFEELKKNHAWTTLKASGNSVGLPEGFQGNSEVGHFTMGSGRITYQSLEEINQAINNREFFKNKALMEACQQVRSANTQGKKQALHLIGMISDEGVHSHINHLFALLEMAKREEAFPIYIHAVLDGRDVPERSAEKYIKMLQEKIHELNLNEPSDYDGNPQKARLATMVGRFYAMDRDSNWERTQQAYDLMVHGKGTRASDPFTALQNAYSKLAAQNKETDTDYYVPPIVFDPPEDSGRIKPGDSVICFNYRTDRARQLTDAFVNKKFEHFKIGHDQISFVAMGPYTELAPVAFPAPIITQNLGQILAQNNIPQLRIAETEKYAHVTYFFNSQVEKPQPLEDRVLIDSPKCHSYADQPEMSARPLTDRAIKEIATEKYGFIAMNYANADLVGHSGNLAATIQCCQILDECLARLVPAALEHGYTVLLTGDHGNAEEMLYPNGEPCPAHSTNPVPLVVMSPNSKITLKEDGDAGLKDIAPTILDLLNIEKPAEMKGTSLI